MGRRLALARALACGGGLYLLDEPFTGVDAARAARILERVRALGVPVLLSSHEAEIVALCDRVIPSPDRRCTWRLRARRAAPAASRQVAGQDKFLTNGRNPLYFRPFVLKWLP